MTAGAHRATEVPQRTSRLHARHRARAARIPSAARHSARLALTITAVSALLLGALGGAAAVFTDRASAGAGVGSGVVIAEFDATGVTNVAVPVTGLLPGGTARRLLDLSNAGTVAMSALQLESSAGVSLSDGVQLALDRCSQPWSADGATCGGTVTVVASDRPATARIGLPGSPALAIGATDHLRLTLRLPESAPTGAQGTSSTLSITVVGVQRAAQHR
ncbi:MULTISPECIES: hypothetical protein [unclassified Rathayibacter]|uniref:hypothetical protein n=1 Tax=unclassified Rathayibacter TaxID=2609250 RepID=UPI000701418E|nr:MULTISPECIES: hypothetical protein [unclassified Rathayibacter]KQQ05912.1 hypothetical protein ASF42_05070 [Rathayibacter sp. Leaf294]KQS13769.1 hypothetical protein ASG06_05080 [Rathayibacter sp. Leaf185]